MRLNSKRISTIVFESALIVFSVLLALFLSELRSTQKQEALMEKALANIRQEILTNQSIVKAQLKTHKEIRDNIAALLKSGLTPTITDSLFAGEIGFDIFFFTSSNMLAPEILKEAAWKASQNANIVSAFSYETTLALSDAYQTQKLTESRISGLMNLLLNDRNTLDKIQLDTTLLILRDYFGELVANEEYLISKYAYALSILKEDKED